MAEVEFSEEEAYQASLRDTAKERRGKMRGLTHFIIRMGLSKDETGASIILIGVTILAVLLAGVIFAFTLTS